MSNIIFNKFQPAPGYDNEKHIYMGPNGLVIEYYFNQDGYFEIIIIKQSGDIYIMDSNINGVIKRTSFIWNDLYAYLQSDFRLRFSLDYVNSHYFNYGSKRVLSRNKGELKNSSRQEKRYESDSSSDDKSEFSSSSKFDSSEVQSRERRSKNGNDRNSAFLNRNRMMGRFTGDY